MSIDGWTGGGVRFYEKLLSLSEGVEMRREMHRCKKVGKRNKKVNGMKGREPVAIRRQKGDASESVGRIEKAIENKYKKGHPGFSY